MQDETFTYAPQVVDCKGQGSVDVTKTHIDEMNMKKVSILMWLKNFSLKAEFLKVRKLTRQRKEPMVPTRGFMQSLKIALKAVSIIVQSLAHYRKSFFTIFFSNKCRKHIIRWRFNNE